MRGHRLAPLLPLALLFAAAPAASGTRAWTDDPDWSQGEEAGVNHTAVPDQLQLNRGEGHAQVYTPFVWIANSGSNTVARIDTRTGQHYPGSPFPVCRDPSRTAVDAEGNVWVNCRGDGHVNKLSAEDGRVLVDVAAGRVMRALAIDRAGYVWAGDHEQHLLHKLDPETGERLASVAVPCPYGAAADQLGNVYVVSHYCAHDDAEAVYKVSTETNSRIGSYAFPECCPYGIAVDLEGFVWIGDSGGRAAVKIDPATMREVRRVNVVGIGRGIAVDADNNMWIALSNDTSDTNEVARVDQATWQVTRVPVGAGPVGVAVDDQNHVWVVNKASATASKVRASDAQVVGTYPTHGSNPYTYSDMTGFAHQSIAQGGSGTWTVRACFPCAVTFGELAYTSEEPTGTAVWVTARSASTEAALASAPESGPLHSGDNLGVATNECLELVVHLTSDDAHRVTPVVHDVTFSYEETGRPETCNGLDDDCDGGVDEELTRPCHGECGEGTEHCEDGVWVDCTTAQASAEICDGLDNDCDGAVDEGVRNACGACGPVPYELCDGLDNDCDGQPDEGDLCPDGQRCARGVCSGACAFGECPAGFVCLDERCVLEDCVDVECPDGQLCRDGACLDPCAGASCPEGWACRSGACVERSCYTEGCDPGQRCRGGECEPDPCAAVECDDVQFCRDGACVDSCAGIDCGRDQRCVDGECRDDACAGVSCPVDHACVDGACTDDPCTGVFCGAGRTCVAGQCADDPCLDVRCPDGQACRRGQCVDDPCAEVNCVPGEVCVDGECVSNVGDADGDTDIDVDIDVDGDADGDADGDTDPDDGTGQLCVHDGDCPGDLICRDDRCAADVSETDPCGCGTAAGRPPLLLLLALAARWCPRRRRDAPVTRR